MDKNYADVWTGLTGEDLIEKMFERTDADGVLFLPTFLADEQEETKTLRCVMDWKTPGDCLAVVQEFNELRAALEQIAQVSDSDGSLKEDAYAALPEAQKQVFDTYLRAFSSDKEFDMEQVGRIGERLEWSDEISPEDREYYDRFHAARDAECRQRLGDNAFAYRAVMRAMRYHRLLTLHAPDMILQIEARALAAALTLLRRCKAADEQG